jgi:hypothetical protein
VGTETEEDAKVSKSQGVQRDVAVANPGGIWALQVLLNSYLHLMATGVRPR